jgi:hypothetical protein
MDKKKTNKKKQKEQKPAEAPEYEIKKVEGFSFKNYSANSPK